MTVSRALSALATETAFALAFADQRPTLDDVRALVEADAIPVAMILKGVEGAAARFRRPLRHCPSPNAAGWKLGHIERAGLDARGSIAAHSERYPSSGGSPGPGHRMSAAEQAGRD